MDFTNAIASSEAWYAFSSEGALGEFFKLFKQAATWLEAWDKLAKL